jgi:tRNA A-37 threonylcarbamoyl transferase component Bud32
MINELHDNGITFYDFHSENIMKRGKDYVVIDLGYSKQKENKRIPVIENKGKQTMRITQEYLKNLIRESLSVGMEQPMQETDGTKNLMATVAEIKEMLAAEKDLMNRLEEKIKQLEASQAARK